MQNQYRSKKTLHVQKKSETKKYCAGLICERAIKGIEKETRYVDGYFKQMIIEDTIMEK